MSTLAHEGFPGHMYQFTYQFNLGTIPKFQRMIESNGYAESWSTNAEWNVAQINEKYGTDLCIATFLNEYFTNISFYTDGTSGVTFPTQPDEIIRVTTYATLRPEIEPGSVTWLDIMMTIPCGCNTAMGTFWVTPLDPTAIPEEDVQNFCVFPNPTTDFVTIEAENLQKVAWFDKAGRMLKSISSCGNSQQLDLRGLPAGTYFILFTNESGSKKQTIIKQ